MTVLSLTETQKSHLKTLDEDFNRLALRTGLSTAAATFLVIGALIIITCGCLCLQLPGINVIHHIILPAVLPGVLAIALSIPFIVMAVISTRQKNSIREETIEQMVTLLDEYEIPEKPEKTRVRFILHNFLDWQSNPDRPSKIEKNTSLNMHHQKKLLGDIKDKMGAEKSERNPRQEKIVKTIDAALIKIQKKTKK